MKGDFLIYGATGFVGEAVARRAAGRGMKPVLAGRNEAKVHAIANELGLEHRAFSIDSIKKMRAAIEGVKVVVNCAGPFLYTFGPVVDSCIQAGVHYLDITGELPVYEAICSRNKKARERGVMLMPGAGFDVVPTDCLAVHLKNRLPSASHLTLAFWQDGPAGLPPGTQRSVIEMIRFGTLVRRDGSLVPARRTDNVRMVDFGTGPRKATCVSWGDIYMAYVSTGIPNITDYMVLPGQLERQLAIVPFIRPIFNIKGVREILKRHVKPGSTTQERARTTTYVWGRVEDEEGNGAEGRLQGPEAGTEWTVECVLAAMARVLAGDISSGFQTPAKAFGPDFVLECGPVQRQDA